MQLQHELIELHFVKYEVAHVEIAAVALLHAGGEGGEGDVGAVFVQRVEVDHRVASKIVHVLVGAELAEHGLVFHVVSVYDQADQKLKKIVRNK